MGILDTLISKNGVMDAISIESIPRNIIRFFGNPDQENDLQSTNSFAYDNFFNKSESQIRPRSAFVTNSNDIQQNNLNQYLQHSQMNESGKLDQSTQKIDINSDNLILSSHPSGGKNVDTVTEVIDATGSDDHSQHRPSQENAKIIGSESNSNTNSEQLQIEIAGPGDKNSGNPKKDSGKAGTAPDVGTGKKNDKKDDKGQKKEEGALKGLSASEMEKIWYAKIYTGAALAMSSVSFLLSLSAAAMAHSCAEKMMDEVRDAEVEFEYNAAVSDGEDDESSSSDDEQLTVSLK